MCTPPSYLQPPNNKQQPPPQVKALAGKGQAEAQALLEGLIKEDVLMVPGFAFDATGGRAEPVRWALVCIHRKVGRYIHYTHGSSPTPN